MCTLGKNMAHSTDSWQLPHYLLNLSVLEAFRNKMDSYDASFHTPGWTVRLCAFLSQFCEVFGDCNQYISPSYHHDRCERWVPHYILHVWILQACAGASSSSSLLSSSSSSSSCPSSLSPSSSWDLSLVGCHLHAPTFFLEEILQ